ncbi:hypothetical protein FGO68_gene15346 [Halteria grandinella]|uniref:Uncharacterized protein n=1 Tax=Halteria grandinella TaxID=5974 RepID=A0A8J8T7T8_HALGN|nr:hypothetical protein FGO68_gene15346 [Halteria grandinella]
MLSNGNQSLKKNAAYQGKNSRRSKMKMSEQNNKISEMKTQHPYELAPIQKHRSLRVNYQFYLSLLPSTRAVVKNIILTSACTQTFAPFKKAESTKKGKLQYYMMHSQSTH